MKNFALIIPVFQTDSILRLFLNSLVQTLTYYSQIIFINDGSGPQTRLILEEFRKLYGDKADICIIENRESRGCSFSINLAIHKLTDCDYVVFMDSDLILQGQWQDCIVEDFEDESLGIVGGILLYPQTGGVQCCGITFQDMTGRHLFLNASPSALNCMDKIEIQTTVFAFCAIRYQAVRLTGFLDENFFNGYEDWDYQFRVRKNGFKAITDMRIQHFHWEKSNGIHRNYNRKGNLGRFWNKHGKDVKEDLCVFLQRGIEKEFHSDDNKYKLIDLCETRAVAHTVSDLLNSSERIRISGLRSLSNLCGNQQTIWLPEIMNSQSFRETDSYLFLCDHYIRLLDNQYWWTLRQRYCTDDKIIDLYGNVMPFHILQHSFWPGTKIR